MADVAKMLGVISIHAAQVGSDGAGKPLGFVVLISIHAAQVGSD